MSNNPLNWLLPTLKSGDLFKVNTNIFARTMFGTWRLQVYRQVDDLVKLIESKEPSKTIRIQVFKSIKERWTRSI
jgi:hypothetical protein